MRRLQSTFSQYGFAFVKQFIQECGISMLNIEDENDPSVMVVQFDEQTIVAFKFEDSFEEVLRSFNHYLTLV